MVDLVEVKKDNGMVRCCVMLAVFWVWHGFLGVCLVMINKKNYGK